MRRERLAFWTAVALCAGVFALRLLALGRELDLDEFQHTHIIWGYTHGLLPYIDYFDHHPPLFHLAMVPLLSTFDTSTFEGAAAFLRAARLAIAVLHGGLLVAVYAAGAAWRGRLVGAIAALFAGNVVMLTHKMIELRPDVPMQLLLALALVAALRRRPLLSGLACGAAAMCSQKMALGGVALALAVPLALGWRAGLRFVAGGLVVPVAVFLAFGPARVLEAVFLSGVGWPRFSPIGHLGILLEVNGFEVLLGLAGAAAALVAARRRADRANLLLALPALALAASVFIMPQPQWQTIVLAIPTLAVLGAALAARRPSALLLIVFTIGPAWATLQLRRPTQERQLAMLERVMRLAGPEDTVLDGFSGYGAFRPHAYPPRFYFHEVIFVMTVAEKQEIARGLTNGAIDPAVVVYDGYLKRLLPRSSLRRYHSPGKDELWVRRW